MATTVPSTEATATQPQPIAPILHTVVLILILIGFSAGNARPHQSGNRIALYLITMAFEWLLVGYVVWGLRRRKQVGLRELVGGRWKSPEDVLLDIAIAIGYTVFSLLLLGGMAYALGLAHPEKAQEARRSLEFLVPHSGVETVLWLGLSATAGFCEEAIYRGYLQRQISILGNSAWVGIVAQGVLFGASHAYEGWRRMLMIAVWGLCFGLLAHFRKSLRPGMITHGGYDAFAGVVLRLAK